MSKVDKEYYAGNAMPPVNQIQLSVIALGITILAINYISLATFDSKVLTEVVFWQRLILLMLVILFSCYTALVYNAYWHSERPDNKEKIFPDNPLRIFALFLIDVFQVAVAAGMFGVLFIPDAFQLQVTGPCRQELTAPGCLGLSGHTVLMIFSLGALWHGTAVAWYAICDRAGALDVGIHAIFSFVYLALALGSHFLGGLHPWIAAGAFAAVLTALFLVQGQRWLRKGN